MTPVRGHAYKNSEDLHNTIQENSSLHSFLPPFLVMILLWC
jgi:hypothetical protein